MAYYSAAKPLLSAIILGGGFLIMITLPEVFGKVMSKLLFENPVIDYYNEYIQRRKKDDKKKKQLIDSLLSIGERKSRMSNTNKNDAEMSFYGNYH